MRILQTDNVKGIYSNREIWILCACDHQASFHKEMKDSEVWHSLFLKNPYCLAVAWLLLHMHLQQEFYKSYPSPFPCLG